MDIVSVDDLIVDIIMEVPGFPKPEGVIIAEGAEMQIGGAGNFLIVASRLGQKVKAIGCVGDDEDGEFLVRGLKSERIDVSGIVVKENLKTKSCIVLVDKRGNKSFVGVFGRGVAILGPEDIDPNVLGAETLYFSGYSLAHLPVKWEGNAVLKAFRFCRNKGMKVFFDPGPLVSLIPRKVLEEVVKSSEILFLNLDEAKKMTKLASLEDISRQLAEFGARMVVIKLGERGSFVYTKRRAVKAPSFKVKVKDPTGAGDAFNAGFIFGYMRSHDFYETALFANAIGALSVTKLGAGLNLPTRTEIYNFLEKNKVEIRHFLE